MIIQPMAHVVKHGNVRGCSKNEHSADPTKNDNQTKGKITEEERARLLLMKAIVEENGTEAERLTEKLQQIQADTMKLADSLTSLKAGDPFSEWDGYFANAKKLIVDLFDQFKAQQALLDNLTKSIKDSREAANANVLAAKADKATAYAEAAKASGNYSLS